MIEENLKSGVKPKTLIFARRTMDGLSLVGGNFAKLNFSTASVKSGEFLGCNFLEVDFNSADLSDCKMDHSNFGKASFFNAKFGAQTIKHSNFSFADLKNAVANGTIFEEVNFSQELSHTPIFQGGTGLKFVRCNLKNCDVPPGSQIIDCQQSHEDLEPEK